jgi:single-strand DNA-binding protein
VVNYTLATSETHTDKEGNMQGIWETRTDPFHLGNLVKRTQWHRIVSWNSAGWLPERVKKG